MFANGHSKKVSSHKNIGKTSRLDRTPVELRCTQKVQQKLRNKTIKLLHQFSFANYFIGNIIKLKKYQLGANYKIFFILLSNQYHLFFIQK